MAPPHMMNQPPPQAQSGSSGFTRLNPPNPRGPNSINPQAQPQLDPFQLRDNHFREQILTETLFLNRQLISSLQETNKSTLNAIHSLTNIVGPLLEHKDRDNRRLRRLLSQRYGVTTEEELMQEQVQADLVR